MKIFILKLSPLKNRGRKIRKGIIHIRATYNNTLITIRTIQGRIISSSSAGICGFRGSRKRTPFAAKIATERAVTNIFNDGIQDVRIYVSGPGQGREIAIRRVYETGIRVTLIRDITSLAHNGCRPPKRRWVL
jgi:small subunit ribosomal protein S11